MSRWLQRIVGVLMLVALAGLPVTASLCIALCESAAAAPAAAGSGMALHHAMGASCHESPAPASRHVMASAGHDCGSHQEAARDSEAAVTMARSTLQPLVAVAVPVTLQPLSLTASLLSAAGSHSRPLSASATRIPLVLRV